MNMFGVRLLVHVLRVVRVEGERERERERESLVGGIALQLRETRISSERQDLRDMELEKMKTRS
jgi:hypothetical protein